uniref:Transmembrane protein n=1 Tax=Medicago truncatula TaxID=3880 RepID=I3T3S4_MEDTR|nr:unknown [Medicago truncatula]
MHFDGKRLLDLGRRDQGTSVMYGSTGLMMDLAIMSFSNYQRIWVLCRYGYLIMVSAITMKLIRPLSYLLYKKPLMDLSLREVIRLQNGVP